MHFILTFLFWNKDGVTGGYIKKSTGRSCAPTSPSFPQVGILHYYCTSAPWKWHWHNPPIIIQSLPIICALVMYCDSSALSWSLTAELPSDHQFKPRSATLSPLTLETIAKDYCTLGFSIIWSASWTHLYNFASLSSHHQSKVLRWVTHFTVAETAPEFRLEKWSAWAKW